ncbi:MAG: LacI family DNA-binding transcriptional regulator [Pseudomonadota bacterium]
MTDKPSLQTVAETAGVSIATVSQVMRGAGRISQATRRKVLDAVRKVAYVPDARAAAMRSGKNFEIGLLIHKIANPFNAEVISGVSDMMETQGYLVSILDSRDEPDREFRHIEALIRNMRGGILWVPTTDVQDETYKLIHTHRIPVVTFLRRSRDPMIDHVAIENMRATEDATNHLADLGHRHIAYVGGRQQVDSRLERIDGYKRVMEQRKLAAPIVIPCEDTKAAGFEIVQKLRQENPEVTGIVCNGDMVALGALTGLQRIGLEPGRDMSVIGFDDIPDAAITTPPLTTMAVQPYELGRKLARAMLDRINTPDLPATSMLIRAVLVERATTGRQSAQRPKMKN